jgi:hypothetical protein
MKVYIGISKYLGFDGLLNLLEADYDTPLATGKSYFERELGADYIGPGDYEIYDRKDYPGKTYDSLLIDRLLPAPFPHPNLDAVDFSEVRTVFYLKNNGRLRSGPSGFIEITDTWEIDE